MRLLTQVLCWAMVGGLLVAGTVAAGVLGEFSGIGWRQPVVAYLAVLAVAAGTMWVKTLTRRLPG